MMKMRPTLLIIGVAVIVTGLGVGGEVWLTKHHRVSSTPAASATATATVTRQTLTVTHRVDGTLGYAVSTAPVINRLPGTYTSLPVEGAVITPGQSLYEVDGQAVVLFTGSHPAWRPFSLGMTDGPDVAQLETNLVNLGFAHGLISIPNNHFDSGTKAAVQRWQRSVGISDTGQVEFGRVVFLSESVRVGAIQSHLGQPAEPGTSPYETTSAQRAVTIEVDATSQSDVQLHAPATIDLPGGQTTPGTVTAVSSVATNPQSNGNGNGGNQNSGSQNPTVSVTITPTDPFATGAIDQEPVQADLVSLTKPNVLAVPVTALLALAEGGFGLEAIEQGGIHQLVPVQTGLYANTLVEVSGPDVHEGLQVVSAK